MSEGKGKIVKCEGRFSQIRNFLYNEVTPVVLEGRTEIGEKELSNIWDLSQTDIFGARFDINDPYFGSRTDTIRKPPLSDAYSLVPLIESQFNLRDGIIKNYALKMGNKEPIARALDNISRKPRDFARSQLHLESKNIQLHGGINLSGYSINANYGIGTIVSGGISRGGIRSDSPFLLEVFKNHNFGDKRGSSDLVAVVGFWAQNNEMLVSQMQPCKNAHFPEDVQFGVAALHIAECIARKIGFEKIIAYGARGHPVFFEHPESWNQFGADFVAIWDCSAKKLGFDGSRNQHHEKDLKNK